MAYINFPRELLDKFCMDAFQKFGFTKEESRIISDVLIMSDDFGIESHGMQRLVRYHKGIESGLIHVDAKPEVVFETPISAVIDGHSGMGQLIGHKAMELAIEKAKAYFENRTVSDAEIKAIKKAKDKKGNCGFVYEENGDLVFIGATDESYFGDVIIE